MSLITYAGEGFLVPVTEAQFDLDVAREFFELNAFTNAFKVRTFGQALDDLEEVLNRPRDEHWAGYMADAMDCSYGCRFHNIYHTGGRGPSFLRFGHDVLVRETGFDYRMSEVKHVFEEFMKKIGIMNPEAFKWNQFSFTK